MMLIGVGSFVIGFTANQMLPHGIKWPVLALTFPWTGTPRNIDLISCDSTFFLLDNLCVVDVRPQEEYGIDHIPGAVSLPFLALFDSPELVSVWDQNQTLVLYCFKSDCKEANMMVNRLRKMGFKNVLVLKEGFAGWIEREYPVDLGGDL